MYAIIIQTNTQFLIHALFNKYIINYLLIQSFINEVL
jgi:hypothetical protein